MADITVIILTMNEEKNISRCINSVLDFAKSIYVVDSGSSDNTCQIAQNLGGKVFTHEFIDYATQYNWALENLPIRTKWVMRLDADEQITDELKHELCEKMVLHENDNINGFVIKLKNFFMGRFLYHGGVYPFKKLMVFKNGFGKIEQRKMDEHTILSEGEAIELVNDALHYDFKDLDSYIKKHNWYASREAQDYIENMSGVGIDDLAEGQLKTRRKEKKLYYKLPMFLRPFLLFVFRYIFQFGFADGLPGLIYSFLGVWWYRFLVDAKIYEYQKLGKEIRPTGALK